MAQRRRCSARGLFNSLVAFVLRLAVALCLGLGIGIFAAGVGGMINPRSNAPPFLGFGVGFLFAGVAGYLLVRWSEELPWGRTCIAFFVALVTGLGAGLFTAGLCVILWPQNDEFAALASTGLGFLLGGVLAIMLFSVPSLDLAWSRTALALFTGAFLGCGVPPLAQAIVLAIKTDQRRDHDIGQHFRPFRGNRNVPHALFEPVAWTPGAEDQRLALLDHHRQGNPPSTVDDRGHPRPQVRLAPGTASTG